MDVLDPRYWENRDANLGLAADLRARLQRVEQAGGERYVERHHSRGKLLAKKHRDMTLRFDIVEIRRYCKRTAAEGQPERGSGPQTRPITPRNPMPMKCSIFTARKLLWLLAIPLLAIAGALVLDSPVHATAHAEFADVEHRGERTRVLTVANLREYLNCGPQGYDWMDGPGIGCEARETWPERPADKYVSAMVQALSPCTTGPEPQCPPVTRELLGLPAPTGVPTPSDLKAWAVTEGNALRASDPTIRPPRPRAFYDCWDGSQRQYGGDPCPPYPAQPLHVECWNGHTKATLADCPDEVQAPSGFTTESAAIPDRHGENSSSYGLGEDGTLFTRVGDRCYVRTWLPVDPDPRVPNPNRFAPTRVACP